MAISSNYILLNAPLSNFIIFKALSVLPWWLSSKESACNVGNLDSIAGLGRSSGKVNGNPFQYSYLENPMDREPSGLQSTGSQRVRGN